jgi:CBS domain-containing protein
MMMTTRLVRDVMKIGVPVCRDTETCADVAARLRKQAAGGEVVVALDEDGMASGWLTQAQLAQAGATQTVGDVMNEDIPAIAPDVPLEAAARMMQARGVAYLFLMHSWPGEPRPAAVISRRTLDQYLREAPQPGSAAG